MPIVQEFVSVRDKANQPSQMSINVVRGAAEVYGVLGQNAESVYAAFLADNLVSSANYQGGGSYKQPINAGVQAGARELKWRVTYRDNTQWLDAPTNTIANPGFGKLYEFTVPTLDQNSLPDGTEQLDLTAYAALVAVIENNVFSPNGGTIDVTEIVKVGRST